MKKRVVQLLIPLLITLIPLVGCANHTPEQAEDSSSKVEVVEEVAVVDEVEEAEEKVLKTDFEVDGIPITTGDYSECEENFIACFEKDFGSDNYELYDCSELTAEILESRKGKFIIERCIGIVTDDVGSGRLLNYENPEFYYISYRTSVKDAKKGHIILSYMVYNPENNYIDDIMKRYDFVISTEYEY